jgi:hypothetical protein
MNVRQLCKENKKSLEITYNKGAGILPAQHLTIYKHNLARARDFNL